MKNNAQAKPSAPQMSDLPKLGAPATRALTAAGYVRLEQFTKIRADQIENLHGVGPKAVRLLRLALSEKGWSFADDTSAGPS